MSNRPGHVPSISDAELHDALRSYVQSVGDNPWPFAGYWEHEMSSGTDYSAMVGLRKLVLCLSALDTELRFKPTQLRSVLATIMEQVPSARSENLPTKLFCNQVMRRVMVLMYHARRSRSLKAADRPRSVAEDTWQQFLTLMSQLNATSEKSSSRPSNN